MSEYAEYYDVDIEDYIKPEPTQKECLSYLSTGAWIFFGGSRGGGKLSPLYSKVCTPKGWVKIGDLKVGDMVTCPVTGGAEKVIAIHPQGKKDIYKVVCDDGATCLVGLEHLWAYKRPNHLRPGTKRSTEREYAVDVLGADIEENRWHNLRVGTTKELIELVKAGEHPRIPLTEPVIFTVNGNTGKGQADPYILGLYLGDGYLANHTITNTDKEIIDYCVNSGFSHSIEIGEGLPKYTLRPTGALRTVYDRWFRKHGLLLKHSWDKFIPKYVFTASFEYRVSFLQGMLDSDGYVDERGRCYYYTTSPYLRDGFIELIRGLGGKCYVNVKEEPKYTYKGEARTGRTSYSILFYVRKTSSMFRLSRKKERCVDSWNGGYENMRAIVSIKKVSHEEAVCITVDHPLGLYITDDFVVTHNSWLARASAFLVAHRYPGIVICIIRETESELVNNFIDKCPLEYPPDIFGYIVKRKDRIIMFDNGSKIIFQPLRNEQDAKKIQGIEYQYIIIDEANNFPITMIDAIKGSLRSAMNNDFVPTLLMTGNPGGLNDMYFKSRYINPNYSMWTPEELKYQHLYVYVKSMTSDNPYIDEAYYQNLGSLDEKRRRAWLEGDWDVFVGQFFTSFSMEKHVVDDFEIPKDWRVVGGLDLGFSKDHPTMCYWLAQDPVTLRIYVCHEYEAYSSIQRYVYDIAYINKTKFENVLIYADKTMWNRNLLRQESDESPAMYFVREGLPLVAANNDRVNGWRMFKQWLHYENDQVPLLQFFRSCNKAIMTLPLLKHATRMGSHTEDCDSRGPDDAADAIRYALVTGFEYPSETERIERQSYYNNVKPQTLETEYKIYNIYGDLNKTFASAAATF